MSLKPIFFIIVLTLFVGQITAAQQPAESITLSLSDNLAPVRQELEARGITPILQTRMEAGAQLHASRLSVDALENFSIELARPDALSLSPVLMAQYRGSGYFSGNFRPLPDDVTLDTILTDTVVALSLYAVGRCDLAQDVFSNLSSDLGEAGQQFAPLLAFVAFYRGNCALLGGDYESAATAFLLSIAHEIPPEQPVVGEFSGATAVNLAWTYLQLEQQTNAFDLLDDRIENAADESQQIRLLSARARLHALTFDYDAAIADLDAALTLDPLKPELYVQRAEHILLIYEWDRALADYDRALELDPDYAEAYYRRGLLFYTQGDRESALTDLERFLELAPDGPLADAAAQYRASIRAELEALEN